MIVLEEVKTGTSIIGLCPRTVEENHKKYEARRNKTGRQARPGAPARASV